MTTEIFKECVKRGITMTAPRRIVLDVVAESRDHPDAEVIHKRAKIINKKIGLASVYRSLNLFEEEEIIEKNDFGDGRARYCVCHGTPHDHLIDIKSGKVIEFSEDEVKKFHQKIAKKLGYNLLGYRLELYASKDSKQ